MNYTKEVEILAKELLINPKHIKFEGGVAAIQIRNNHYYCRAFDESGYYVLTTIFSEGEPQSRILFPRTIAAICDRDYYWEESKGLK